jgi:hypothetical protein
MTRPTPPVDEKRIARDIARHLGRRRRRGRLALWTALLGAVAAAALYLRCGEGFGLGDLGKGFGEPGEPHRAADLRCAIRITGKGIVVDGKPMNRAAAVAACKATGKADVVVTGDAPHADKVGLIDALHAAGITDIVVHEPPARTAPRDEPKR